VILYEMLAGRRPAEVGHDRELTLMEKVTRSMLQAVVPLPELNPTVPGHVWGIVERALQKKRELRFATMREMADALVEALKRVRREHGKKPSFAEREGAQVTGGVGAVTVGEAGEAVDAGLRPAETRNAVSTPKTALATATTDPAPLFGELGTVKIGEIEGSATTESDLSTLAASSRSVKLPPTRGRLPLPVLVGGMVLGVGIGALVFWSWTPNAATLQTVGVASSDEPLQSRPAAADAGGVESPRNQAEAGAPVTDDAGVPVATGDTGAEKKAPGGQSVVQPPGKNAPPSTNPVKLAPKKCAGIACEPDL